ncbi:hypothetical protein PAPYR_12188 [Paratrimastix pyriformis]|uniref:Secreted protein n=1 Tax=Paratrimastix pyriformis TaxID=342808 RepID=A0ABQ8U956_9EUKA|nr:hypothetical protein PAPYR_12188 [Paratrimastix pyriformis]
MAAMQGYLCPLGVHCWVLFLYHRRYGVSLRGSPQGRRNAVALWVTGPVGLLGTTNHPAGVCTHQKSAEANPAASSGCISRTRQKSAEANPATSSGGELPVTHGS